MVINALTEVLFWSDIPKTINNAKELAKKYFPDNPEMYFSEREKFIKKEIPTKEEFIRRLEYYEENGTPTWVGGRNDSCDDISFEDLKKSIIENSTSKQGEILAKRHASVYSQRLDFWKFYTDNIFAEIENNILELTVGAGLGTSALMQRMSDKGLYMGVDIDFICAKQADALAKYHKVNGLGIATSLWNMPFDNGIFSSVCSNNGLDECREIPTILKEAARALKPKGKMALICRDKENSWYPDFRKYGFSDDEIESWLKKVRLYAGAEQIENLASDCGLHLISRREEKSYYGKILVFEKLE